MVFGMWKACGAPTTYFVALTRKCHIEGRAHIAKQKAKKEALAKHKDEAAPSSGDKAGVLTGL